MILVSICAFKYVQNSLHYYSTWFSFSSPILEEVEFSLKKVEANSFTKYSDGYYWSCPAY